MDEPEAVVEITPDAELSEETLEAVTGGAGANREFIPPPSDT